MHYRHDTEDFVLAEYYSLAEAATKDMSSLIRASEGLAISSHEQPEGFHCFFFLSASSTSTQLRAPRRVLPHLIGTQWLLRVLRQAIYQKQRQTGDNFLANVSSNQSFFGIIYESSLLCQIQDGQLRCLYDIPGASGFALPQTPDTGLSSLKSPYQEVYLDRRAALPLLQWSDLFFVRVATNFPTVDAVIITPNRIVLLQITVASRLELQHSGLNRIYQLVEHNDLLQGRQWHFVFLGPRKESVAKLCSSKAATDLVPYARHRLNLNLQLGSMAIPPPPNVSLPVLHVIRLRIRSLHSGPNNRLRCSVTLERRSSSPSASECQPVPLTCCGLKECCSFAMRIAP